MDFELDGHTYKVGTIDARKQFHIVRRLAPVIGTLAPAIQNGKNEVDILPVIAEAISGLSDDDADYCIFGLLTVIARKQENGLGWGPVCNGLSIMYSDITMPVMMQLAWRALSFNMGNFFPGINQVLNDQKLKANDQ